MPDLLVVQLRRLGLGQSNLPRPRQARLLRERGPLIRCSGVHRLGDWGVSQGNGLVKIDP